MTYDYDVIVIGAGNGGLMAAATASKLGKKVLLLERHNIPGGAATSFSRGRFEFEVSLHELAAYGSASNPQPVRQLFDSLGIDIKMDEIPEVYRYIVTGKDGFDISLPTGREAFINKIEEVVPGSRNSLTHLFDYGEECKQAFGLLSVGKSMAEVASRCPHFGKYAATPYETVLQELQMPLKTRQIVEGYWQYIGIPADDFNFPFFSYMLITYVEDGAYTPANRSHGMSSAILKNIQDHGGTVWMNTEVQQILMREGRAIGVKIGDRAIYGKQIICNAAPNFAYSKLMTPADVPSTEKKLANARKLGETNFMVYLGLNKSPEELGIKDYSVFIADTGNTRKQFNNMGTMDKNNFIIMDCLNIADPACSPAGTTILYATKLFQNGVWDQVKPAEYHQLKVKTAQEIIQRYEEVTGIKIHDAIEEIEIAAPETFARYMRTPNGATYGYYGQNWDQILQRMANLNKEIQPIPHLYFCGGASFMLDGYSSAFLTGATAAKMACAAIDQEGVNND
ncbi:phytoene desaturase family protein [Limosilactobacillus sp.]|uniref:phytoene desaturase family protein n=1 Tax=Limosilactobacillus sp. TaxID=2773925 RepID=UPI003F027771